MAEKAIMKQIAEQKLKAFSIGTMGKRPLSKKELEEQRKKEQEQAAAQAFEEFVATFQETPNKTTSKVWVKAGTYDAGKRQEDTREKGKLYKPQSKISELVDSRSSAEQAQEYAKLLGSNERKIDRLGKKKKEGEKKKSNLELFKEELKMIQEEREERHKYKGVVKTAITSQSEDPMIAALKSVEDGSFDNGDPNTTNLYLGNLNPKITEQQLMEIFGKYGPLASIKIMWPRSDEEKARQRNCGFVAFMSRKDGERALKNLNALRKIFHTGRDIMQYEMKLGWGKSVPIPPYPIYIPPALMEITQPPPPSGLPFNAQPHRRDRHKNAVVKVVIPTERNLVMLIHRMVEFVIREGPMFEAMIMNRELNNPMFRFLFENYSPAHTYYRWKLYSILQGDGQKEWRTSDFRMFKGGSVWRPPPINPWTQGMPEDLIEMEERQEPRRGSLSNSQRDRLEDLLRNISPERLKVAEVMVFCIEHAEAAEEICDCIAESLSIIQTPVNKKIARLYLISDILHNCGVKVTNATIYRKAFEARLLETFAEIHQAYKHFDSRLKAEGFKIRVMRIFKAWEEWAVYPRDFLLRLQNTFLGLVTSDEPEMDNDEDIDGAPLSDVDGDTGEDLDGVPLDGAALLKGAMKLGLTPQPSSNYDDIDGVPMEDDIDGVPMDENRTPLRNKTNEKKPLMPAGFVPSRWETVDPDQVEAQAMTTSKWEELGQNDDSNSQDASMDSSSRDYNEERRTRLREIEVKTMQYQDELESGRRTLKPGMTILTQVEHYRKKLIRKYALQSERDSKDSRSADRDDEKRKERRRSTSPDSPLHYRDRRRSPGSPSKSSNRYRSRSKSPRSKRRSRSPHKKRAPLTPSPPRIRTTPSPVFSGSRTSRRSPGSERGDRKRRARSPSMSPPPPPPSRSSVKHRTNSPPSPSSRKHRHKHKY
ncbi:hypothetical protein PV326_013705 [Microctonus aethiopoides]|nr:hypothetical protein PV326_013705 [Microctonus aethiopoides]